MAKLKKECENYVLDNPDEFQKMEEKPRAKFDYVDNKAVDLQGKKKKNKDGLDDVQQAEVQALVIRRFRRYRKDIIAEDDEYVV